MMADDNQDELQNPRKNAFLSVLSGLAMPDQDESAPDHLVDDKAAGIRGNSAQAPRAPVAKAPSNDSGFYAGASYNQPNDPRFPLEKQVATDQTELSRMNKPTQMSLSDRIKSGIGGAISGALTGARGEGALEQQETLRDRMAQRKQEAETDLANRISLNQRTIAGEGMENQRMAEQERLATQKGDLQSRIEGEKEKARTATQAESERARSADLNTRLDAQEKARQANEQSRDQQLDKRLSQQSAENDKRLSVTERIADKRIAAGEEKDKRKQAITDAKTTPDEQKRYDLAENFEENLKQLEDISTRRPDLFGPVHGRMTKLKNMIGSNDPDVGALNTIHDQIGMVTQSTHGMRSAHHVSQAADSIMAGFLNGPEAIRGSIKAARASLQTFKDDVDRERKARGAQPLGGNPAQGGGQPQATHRYVPGKGIVPIGQQ